MNKISNKLYLFNALSEEAKQKALKMLQEPFIEVDNEVWSAEGLIEDIENVYFYEDGTVA